MGAYHHANNTVPAHGAIEVTPSDTTPFATCRSLYVGVTGSLTVRMADGQTVTFVGVAVGYHPLQVDMVLDTGTDADSIVALY